MVILGARGHALEIMDVLLNNDPGMELCFFEDVVPEAARPLITAYPVIHTRQELADRFLHDKDFILGTGNPLLRRKLFNLAMESGGEPASAISRTAYISPLNVCMGKGLNIMHGVILQPHVTIGDGTLINAAAVLHHQTTVGAFCEICPGAILTGHVQVADNCFIGAGAVILPGIKIGANAKVGAGAVVTRDVAEDTTVVGNPARMMNLPE